MLARAYSRLEIRSVDEEKRELVGIATTPSTDRYGDIVESAGAEFELPLPFLWQHDSDQPVGHVIEAKVREEGIEVRVALTMTDEPGKLKERLDEAWQSIKLGLVRGLSIGFRSIEHAYIEGTYGIRFIKWDWLELSAVTIPANADASITSIKRIDTAVRAALGKPDPVRSRPSPGVSGAQGVAAKAVRINKSGVRDMAKKTYGEQIADLESTRKVKTDRLEEITQKTLEEGRTKDASEREEFDTLRQEVKALDAELVDLREMEKMQAVKTHDPVTDAARSAGRPAAATTHGHVQVKNTQKLAPGIAFARYARCLAISHHMHRDPVTIARSLYPDDERISNLLEAKAAVAAATTGDPAWAGNLVSEDGGGIFADFVEFLRPQTILGRFGTGGVPSLRRVPFRVPLIGQSTGGNGYWVGEGQAKPLTKFDFARTNLEPLKVANIAVATKEVLRDSSPSAETLIRDSLAAALRERLDIDFIDPAKAAAAGVSPASVLNGISGIPSSGVDADAVRDDIKALFNSFIAGSNAPTTGVWIMPATTALALSLMQNPLGQSEFPGLTMSGGLLFGLPAIVSEYVPTDSSGAVVALVNAQDIYMADDGGISIDMSTEASLQMDDAPDNPGTAATVMVSLWQRNMVGFLAERTINWSRRRTNSVAYLTGVNWGASSG